MGSQSGMRLGMPNWSAPVFPKPMGSPAIMAVVGIPELYLTIPPICHPPNAVLANPWNDCGVGMAQRVLMETVWATLKSDGPRRDFGANQNKELRPWLNVSPAMVAELSSSDFPQV